MIKSMVVLVCLIIASTTFAAGNGGHGGSPMDLIAPFVNFVILFGFLFFVLKGKLKTLFASNAKEVQALYERAEMKDKEADLKLKHYQEKLTNFEGESQKIFKSMDDEANKFVTSLKEETEEELKKMELDSVKIIETERKSMLKEIETELLESVLLKAKDKIKSDTALRNKATDKLVSKIS